MTSLYVQVPTDEEALEGSDVLVDALNDVQGVGGL